MKKPQQHGACRGPSPQRAALRSSDIAVPRGHQNGGPLAGLTGPGALDSMQQALRRAVPTASDVDLAQYTARLAQAAGTGEGAGRSNISERAAPRLLDRGPRAAAAPVQVRCARIHIHSADAPASAAGRSRHCSSSARCGGAPRSVICAEAWPHGRSLTVCARSRLEASCCASGRTTFHAWWVRAAWCRASPLMAPAGVAGRRRAARAAGRRSRCARLGGGAGCTGRHARCAPGSTRCRRGCRSRLAERRD
jgi:hypothetical protein